MPHHHELNECILEHSPRVWLPENQTSPFTTATQTSIKQYIATAHDNLMGRKLMATSIRGTQEHNTLQPDKTQWVDHRLWKQAQRGFFAASTSTDIVGEVSKFETFHTMGPYYTLKMRGHLEKTQTPRLRFATLSQTNHSLGIFCPLCQQPVPSFDAVCYLRHLRMSCTDAKISTLRESEYKWIADLYLQMGPAGWWQTTDSAFPTLPKEKEHIPPHLRHHLRY